MKGSFEELIKQSFKFPQEGFRLSDGNLDFNGISIMDLIEKYGTPFKLMYLPKIAQQISNAREIFKEAFDELNYQGNYHYCYCTKCCHYSKVVQSVLKENVHLETSSAFDVDIILALHEQQQLSKETTLIHNGYKTDHYLQKIIHLNQLGFENSILILDSAAELAKVKKIIKPLNLNLKIGIRMAIDEEPQSPYHTSRLGIRPDEVIALYENEIKDVGLLNLTMLHFFIDSGIKDQLYYWSEFKKALNLYADLRLLCDDLKAINLGGGFPIRNNLDFKYDYKHLVFEIVRNIKETAERLEINHPDIYTEFGRYTVGESGATILQVLEKKHQNDQELWFMVDNSLMNILPDTWSILEKFIVLPINKWDNDYTKVNIGGISCDHSDFYDTEDFNQKLILPNFDNSESQPLYIGFFHTAAYQDALSGYGGIKHCLIPAPKIIFIDQDEDGKLFDYIYQDEQTVEDVLSVLGYSAKN